MNVEIREAQPFECELLGDIEIIADTLFAQAGYALENYETQPIGLLEDACRDNRLWVAIES